MRKRIAVLFSVVLILGFTACKKGEDPEVVASREESSRQAASVSAELQKEQDKLNEFGWDIWDGTGCRLINLKGNEKRALYSPFVVISSPVENDENYHIIEKPEDHGLTASFSDSWTTDYTKAKSVIVISYTRTEQHITSYSNGGSVVSNTYNVNAQVFNLTKKSETYYLSTKFMEIKLSKDKTPSEEILGKNICDFLKDKCYME